MRYLFDTNICIYIAKKKPLTLLERFKALEVGDAAMSIVTYLELIYGAYKSERIQFNLATLRELVSMIPVLSLDVPAAEYYGRLRTDLERQGRTIGGYDLMIAAHAMSLNLTLITHNTREFPRISSLRIENWA
jgi:tRNA(fMet)-specific endonuclease VapC